MNKSGWAGLLSVLALFAVVTLVQLSSSNLDTVTAADQILTNDFDQNGGMWQSYGWTMAGEVPIAVYSPAVWASSGGVSNSGYIWSDHTRWGIDYPDSNSILALLKYHHWDGNPALDLRNSILSVHAGGEELDLKGGQLYFWILNDEFGVRYHYTAQPIPVGPATFLTPTKLVIRNHPGFWFNSWARNPSNVPPFDYVLEHVDSYGFSFRGMRFAEEVTGKLIIDELSIVKYEPVTASFEAEPSAGIAPLQVELANTTIGDYDYTSIKWHMGDGTTSSEANPAHTYTAPGVYTVTLSVNGPLEINAITTTSRITVYAPVVADFAATPQSGVAPLQVEFTNQTSGDYSIVEWNFGDGVTSTVDSPIHTFTTPGLYTVTLSASGFGGSDAIVRTDQIKIYTPVSADFAATPQSGVAPLQVALLNKTTGDYSASTWRFGDGVASAETSVDYTYTVPGVYTVTLTASGLGGLDTLTRTNLITVHAPLAADFMMSPTSGVAPLRVLFSNGSSGHYSATIWDFGDGNESAEAHPIHIYDKPGLYQVTLSAIGLDNDQRIARSGPITVYEPVVADFMASPLNGLAPLQVMFTDTTTGDYTTIEWNFGDGATSTESHPTHTYTTPGVYAVTLSASGPGGESIVTQARYIRVYRGGPGSFAATATNGFVPLEVTFTPTISFESSQLEWNFGDGTTSTETNPTHIYTAPGAYDVTLLVHAPEGPYLLAKAEYVVVKDRIHLLMPKVAR